MYASTVYVGAIGQFRSAVNTIRKAQRLINILCSRTYKDISFIASTVLAGTPPLDFLIEKRSVLYCMKKGIEPVPWVQLGPLEVEGKTLKNIESMIDERISIEWQKLWDREPSDKWAKKLIPRVTNRYMARIERPNFLLFQAITGHGAFGTYLFRLNKRTTAVCQCGNAPQDPEQVFKICPRFEVGRPLDWDGGIESGAVRQYLISTVKKLWEEEQEEERRGVSRTRRSSYRPRRAMSNE